MENKLSPASLATKFVNSTDRHVFLTGKAGTGKTTFLKNIVHQTHKKAVIAAPTGIAAINAEGVTLHSLFHLPFGSFIPSNNGINQLSFSTELHTPKTLLKSLRMNSHKRKLLQELELLIIDEVSMLRADTLDAIDTILRSVRKKRNQPFGGIQILFIGDLLQLPPVVKHEEKDLLQTYYPSEYFFEAYALKDNQPVYIELEKIFRQSDKQFITLLNHFRENSVTRQDLEILNNYHKPSFKPSRDEGYVFLTTHNRKADEINRRTLKKLPGKSYYFEAYIEGDFGEHLYPVDYRQEFKKEAQVMFIKNDYSGENRYFNGKIGYISELTDEEIEVSFQDGSPSTTVERYTWENKRYTLNKETNSIEEKVKGTFSQFPIRLAWAITVHKSQGLTFNKAIIDVSQAFAPGQIYVALSRLVSLEGLVLNAPIPLNILEPDETLKKFSNQKKQPQELHSIFEKELPLFVSNYAMRAFDFSGLVSGMAEHLNTYNKDEKKSMKQKQKSWAVELKNEVVDLKAISDKFQKQLKRITEKNKVGWLAELLERVTSAKEYFEPKLKAASEKIAAKKKELEGIPGVKTFRKELTDLDSMIFNRRQTIHKAEALIKAARDNREMSNDTLEINDLQQKRKQELKKSHSEGKKTKKPKSNTKQISYDYYKQGYSVEDIAEKRSLAVSTIEGHLAHWIEEGKLDVSQFVDKTKINQIITVAEAIESTRLRDIKDRLGDEFTFSDIRYVMAHYKRMNSR